MREDTECLNAEEYERIPALDSTEVRRQLTHHGQRLGQLAAVHHLLSTLGNKFGARLPDGRIWQEVGFVRMVLKRQLPTLGACFRCCGWRRGVGGERRQERLKTLRLTQPLPDRV
jgi:hypothetical protein